MTRLLLILSILPYCLSLVDGLPVNHSKINNVQPQPQMPTDTSSSNIDVTTLSTSLGEYYEGIADQVLISFTEKILSSVQLTFKSKGDSHYQDADPKMQKTFRHSLKKHLNFMRGNLIASVQPLVDTNLPWVLSPTEEEKKKKQEKSTQKTEIDYDDENDDDDDDEEKNDDENDNDDDDEEDEKPLSKKKKSKGDRKMHHKRPPTTLPIWSIPLTRDIRILNQRISTQLGRIVNAHKTAHLMIHQSLARAKKMKSTTATQNNHPSHPVNLSPHINQVAFSYPKFDPSSVALKNKPVKLEWNSRDLETWLRHSLLDIEKSLKTEFNERIQDAVQCIMEDFSV